MSKKTRYTLLFLGLGIFILCLGLSQEKSSNEGANFKNGLTYLGMGIFSLTLGLSWGKTSYGGGMVHKYGSIVGGCFFILLSILSFFNLR
ncbi:MAG: hypothetical protein V4722_06115 [Bacteroidota bacterium]